MRIRKLHIENWRNFRSVRVPLQRRAFIVGPNASGKSNLLEVFRFLHDLVAVGGGLEEAVAKRGGFSKLRALSAHSNQDVAIEVQLGEEETDWGYRLKFNENPLPQGPRVLWEGVKKGSEKLLERPLQGNPEDEHQLRQTHLEQTGLNQKFRDIFEFFESIQYLHIIPQLIRDPERYTGREGDPYGADFLHQIAQTEKAERQRRLKYIEELLRVAAPQFKRLEFGYDNTGAPRLRAKHEHWRSQGAWQTEEVFSDGTLRLIGLLWAAMAGEGPLLLEEPELSLHPAIVRQIPLMLEKLAHASTRQIIISTHSMELLEDEGIGLDEVVILKPGKEGTTVQLASDHEQIKRLLDGGLPLPEAVMPETEPPESHRLPTTNAGR